MLIRGTTVVYRCTDGHLTPVYVADSGPEPRAIYCIHRVLGIPCSEEAKITRTRALTEARVEFFKPTPDDLDRLLRKAPELVERALGGGLLIRDRG